MISVQKNPIFLLCTLWILILASASIAAVDFDYSPLTTAADTLANDSWVEGQNANFQSGFVTGEMAASRLVPGQAGAQPLNNVHFFFGGDESLQTITLHIWQDSAGGNIPGGEIYSNEYALWGSNSAWHEIDLSTEGISVDGPIRVGIEFHHDGAPSVARDNDGITPDRNYIYASDGNWYEASVLGVPGDWIIRASTGDGEIPGTPPTITSITDVAGDQGRSVRLIWQRASYDAPGSLHPITDYAVFRRQDARQPHNDQSRLFGWDFVSTVPAFGENNYQCIAPTLCDSTGQDGVCWSVFMIRAMTSSPYEFHDSAPDSGYSVDNLAPSTPAGFMVAYGPDNTLSWQPSDDHDFRYFKIYRGDHPDFTIDPSQPLTTVTGTNWLDQDGNFESCYRISCVDFAGNESPATEPQGITAADDIPPGRNTLLGNAPNPFNPQTTISFELDSEGPAHLTIYNVSGRHVRTLLSGEIQSAGRHEQLWNGRDDKGLSMATGVYFYHLKVDDFQQTRRMALIK